MMFSTEDLKIHDTQELLEFIPIVFFVALCSPYILGAYSLGFALDKLGLMD